MLERESIGSTCGACGSLMAAPATACAAGSAFAPGLGTPGTACGCEELHGGVEAALDASPLPFFIRFALDWRGFCFHSSVTESVMFPTKPRGEGVA